MGNVLTGVKRFLQNKNTVTIIGVILAILVLYVFYNYRVKQATTPQSIPYAKQEITSRTLITTEMIGWKEVSGSMVKTSPNLVTNSQTIVGKYVAYGTNIPENSFFYTTQLMTKDELPDSAFANIPDGYTGFNLSVNLQTTYGNSIYPGNYIDLYLKAYDNESQKIIFGRLIESIEVLAVKDSNGQPVFESTKENRTPSTLVFAVPNDMFDLLMKANYISASVEILPVPRNASYSANPGETLVKSEYIRDFILSKAVTLPDEDDVTIQGGNGLSPVEGEE